MFGGEVDFVKKALEASKKLGSKRSRLVQELRQNFHEKGDEMALEEGQGCLQEAQNLTIDDREILFGYLEGAKRLILVEPQPLVDPVTEAFRFRRIKNVKKLW